MSDNIFDLYSRKPAEPTPQKEPYVAYGLGKPAKALVDIAVQRDNQALVQIEKANLHDVISTHETLVGLVYDKCLIEFRGRHLTPLIELLLYYEIRFAERFDAARHREPSETYPLIDRIRWKPVFQANDQLVPAREVHTDIHLVVMK